MLSFLKTETIFGSFRNDGKSPLLIEALLEGWTKSVNMSTLSLIILVGTSVFWQALKVSKQPISWQILWFLDPSTAFLLGWPLYFKTILKTGSLILL